MTDSSPQEPPEHPGTPRWVKVFAIVAAVLALLVVVLMLVGGGQHGPGRHLSSTCECERPPASTAAVEIAPSAHPSDGPARLAGVHA